MTFTPGHALIIGVGADLPTTIDDAQGLADILRDPARCAYPPAQVQVLTGAHATRAHILAALERLAQAAPADATVIVAFSGHGYRVISDAGTAYFLLPFGYDVANLSQTAISGSDFTARLRAIPAQKLVLLLDCCHAGGVGDAKGVTLAKAPLPPEAQALLAEGRGRVVLASSRASELSYAGTPYSAFTLALIEALCGTGVATPDGYVRVADLALHTRQMVPGRTQDRQHPVLHFEQADNFVVAHYAGGETQPKGLPFTTEPQIEPEPGTLDQQRRQQQVSGTGAVGVGGDAHAPITTGSGNTITTTGDIRDNSGQVAVGSNIAQASGGGSAHVDSSRSVFDQRGQKVGGSQYNAARDMTIGRERQEPRRQESDRRLAQAVQTALERYGLDDVLFNLGSHTDLAVNTDTLGADAVAQARNLVTLCRVNKQRAALVACLRAFEDGLLGSPDEEKAWLAWARELDGR
jgi:hypothetical protein